MYHMDSNVLLGAPTGSGKTIVAELAILKLFRDQPDQTLGFRIVSATGLYADPSAHSVIYIAPLKALARERLIGWRLSLGRILGVKIVEITGSCAALLFVRSLTRFVQVMCPLRVRSFAVLVSS